MANGGYAIIDLGLTEEEQIEAITTGSFSANEEMFNIILDAIETGKEIKVPMSTQYLKTTLAASPIIHKVNNEITTVGWLTAPVQFGGNIVSIMVYISKYDYSGVITPIVLKVVD